MFGPKTQQGLGPGVLGGGGGGLGGLSGGTSGLGLGGELAWSTYFQHSCMYRIAENFREFHGFVAIHESFLHKIWGMGSFGAAKVINLQKFSPRKS